jgi:hypothetical protein
MGAPEWISAADATVLAALALAAAYKKNAWQGIVYTYESLPAD